MMAHYYTKYQREYIRKRYRKYTFKALAQMFNANFGTDLSTQAIKCYFHHHGFYKTDGDGRFKKGHEGYFKGWDADEVKKHYTDKSWANTCKDTLPHVKKHNVGDRVFIFVNGERRPYIITSVEDGVDLKKRMMPETRYIWEQYHKPLKKGEYIMHKDGDVMNNDISNLALVDGYERCIINHYGWQGNDELFDTGVMIAKLQKSLKNSTKNGRYIYRM